MDTFQSNKLHKGVYVLIALVIVVVVGVVILQLITRNKKPAEQSTVEQIAEVMPVDSKEQLKVDRTEVEESKLPDRLPVDLPFESGVKITQNYTATTEDGRFQATRAYETTKSFDDIAKSYQDYFKTKGWTESTNVKQDKLQVISASKGNEFITVTLNENSINKVKTVEVTLLQVNLSTAN